MNKEIAFEQIAHFYSRSELRLVEQYYPTVQNNTPHIFLSVIKSGWYKTMCGERVSNVANWDGVSGYMPLFISFENLIKPVKANKFVAELLGINEGDEYTASDELNKIRLRGYGLADWDCEVQITTLLIAAGYNVYNIKDCRYE